MASKNRFRRRPIPISVELANALKNKPRVIYVGRKPKGRGLSQKRFKRNTFFTRQTVAHPDLITGINESTQLLWLTFIQRTRILRCLLRTNCVIRGATLSANDSVDLLQLAKLLGHSDLKYANQTLCAYRCRGRFRRALKIDAEDE